MSDSGTAIVISTTRRYIEILDDQLKSHNGIAASRAIEACVGDRVRYELTKEGCSVNSIEERKNCLQRSFGTRSKTLVTNLDRLFVVTAVKPLFNTIFIDRLLTSAFVEDIPVTLVVNKLDQKEALELTQPGIEVYRQLGVEVLLVSAAKEKGLEQLKAILASEDLHLTAFCGISGVGKSTILNTLVPNVAIRTQNVSERTGQGKQTTSRAIAYQYAFEKGTPKLIVDLPGVQNFGISHILAETVRGSFKEFIERVDPCPYADCSHIREKECSVRDAVKSGLIAESRYNSYLNMIEETDAQKHY